MKNFPNMLAYVGFFFRKSNSIFGPPNGTHRSYSAANAANSQYLSKNIQICEHNEIYRLNICIFESFFVTLRLNLGCHMNNGLIVRNVMFINRAPFERLDLKFIDGINVLSSENGRGKTTIMSYIVDALHEMAKKEYSQSYIGHETAWYRVSSSAEMMDSNRISLVYI